MNKFKTSNPKVYIIILNWNGIDDTIECLQSLRKTDYSNYEIIIIDNASLNQEAESIKSKFPEITLIKNNRNFGFAAGNNLGLKRALADEAQYAWLLNNDSVVEPNTLSELIRQAEETPNIGMLSPYIHYYSTPDKIQFHGTYLDWHNYRLAPLEYQTTESTNNESEIILVGTALLIKREVIEKIGYLNEKYFAYFEDSEYSLRTLKAGFVNKLVPSAKIFHKASINYPQNTSARHWFYMARNEYWFWKDSRNHSPYIFFLLKYLAKNLRRIGALKEIPNYENMNACIDGIYCAFCDISGEWKGNVKMPYLIKRIAFWRPYLLADILEVNFSKILRTTIKKLRVLLHKLCLKLA